MRLAIAGCGLLLLAAVPSLASAQCAGATCTITIQMPVHTIVRMTLSSISADLGTPTAANFITGHREAVGPSLTVKANRSYLVDVEAESATFITSSKLASDLEWGAVSGTYPNDVGTSAMLTSGGATAGSAPVAIYYRTLWSFANDPPGNYTINVRYTLSAP